MNINEPTKDQIDRIKAQYADRSLHLVEVADKEEGGDTYFFVMTGQTRDEHKKYVEEMLDGHETKGGDKMVVAAIRKAVETAALAMIRHPDREEAKRVFDLKPMMIEKFSEQLKSHAGSNVEVRSKKL